MIRVVSADADHHVVFGQSYRIATVKVEHRSHRTVTAVMPYREFGFRKTRVAGTIIEYRPAPNVLGDVSRPDHDQPRCVIIGGRGHDGQTAVGIIRHHLGMANAPGVAHDLQLKGIVRVVADGRRGSGVLYLKPRGAAIVLNDQTVHSQGQRGDGNQQERMIGFFFISTASLKVKYLRHQSISILKTRFSNNAGFVITLPPMAPR